MSRRVPEEWLDGAAAIPDLAASSGDALWEVVRRDEEIRPWLPEPRVAVDPRTGARTVYSPARAKRPHDHPPPPPPDPEECVVCAGKTTTVVDRAPLSGGHETFVNLNLFPVVAPLDGDPAPDRASGVHLLQWVSTDHEADFHNADPDDLAVVIERMGVLEDRLYRAAGAGMPETGPGRRGHVAIVKNVGRLVGGSLVHGHQQILQTNVAPRALELDAEFLRREGVPFARFLLDHNPEALTVASYDKRFRTVAPFFQARPFDLIVVAEDPDVKDVRDLDDAGRLALAGALRDATAAVVGLLPEIGREVAYNLTFRNGIAGGLYVEVLPWSQERGGYEALGLGLCEGTPEDSAARVRRFLRDGGAAG